jgi:hypothetical protein
MLRSLFLTTFFASFVVAQTTLAPECGGSSSSSTPGAVQNTVPIVVNPGPANEYFNGAFASVTVCVPGTSNCQTIDGVLVDTGSTGFRVLSSALTVQLPHQAASNGSTLAECFQFLDGFTWGPVEGADVKMAGEVASNIPIQVIGTAGLPPIPGACSATGAAENTLADLGANGVLGVGLFLQDCGSSCSFVGASNPGLYYGCTAAGCQVVAQSLAQQVINPVAKFSSDNNGVVIQLPTILPAGQNAASGLMSFGIGTQSDNALGSAKVYTTNASGNFATVFNGTSYSGSFIDSGSNGYYFLDSTTTGLPLCPPGETDFYCPPTPQNLSATMRGANGNTAAIAFTIANADPFLNSPLSVFPNIGGTNPGSFDWGLPFFFGRTVFTAIEGVQTPGGVGPYWAF